MLLRGQKQRRRNAFPTVTHEQQTPVSRGCSSALLNPYQKSWVTNVSECAQGQTGDVSPILEDFLN